MRSSVASRYRQGKTQGWTGSSLQALAVALVGGMSGVAQGEAALLEGFTEPAQTVDIAAPEPGVLARVMIKEGDQVAPGTVLAQLDNRVLEATRKTSRILASATARMRAAQVQRGLSDMRLRRLQDLAASGSVRGDELAMARAEADKAAAEVAAAEETREYELQRLAEIDARLAERTLTSPLAGVVTRIHHDVGEFIGAGAMQTVTVVQLDPLHVTLFASAAQSAQFIKGQMTQLLCGPQALAYAATVEFVSPVIEPESGTVRMVLSLANPDHALRSGLRCRANPDHSSSVTEEPDAHE